MTYEAFNLRSNPFMEESPDFDQIDREDVEGQLHRDLSDAIVAGSPQIIVILGEYGMGKTFLMQNLERSIKNNRFLNNAGRQSLGVYFRVTPPKLPSGYLAYVYGQVVRRIGRSWFRTTMAKMREESKMGEIGVTRELASIDSDFQQALSRFGGQQESLAWRYLRGDSLKAAEMKKLKVEGKLTSDDAALSGVLNILRLAEISQHEAILLFIDELEYIFSAASSKKLVQVMNTFKDLYDRVAEEKRAGRPGASLHFIFASTPSAYHDSIGALIRKDAPALQAFWERVFRTVNLRPFRTKEAIDLVKSRLRARRVSHEPDDLFPFDKATISEIANVAQGIPRRIIRICAYALIDIAEREIASVDHNTLRRVLEFYPWAKETASPVASA